MERKTKNRREVAAKKPGGRKIEKSTREPFSLLVFTSGNYYFRSKLKRTNYRNKCSPNMMSGLPVIISGERKIVVGISPITEVSHILEVLQKAYGLKIPTRSLTILERWREIEKPLRNSELIYDRWNSWDAEKVHVSYVLKRRKSDGRRKLRRRSFKTQEFIDEVVPLRVLEEEDFRRIYEKDDEAFRFIESVRRHFIDLENLSDVNSRLEEEENKIIGLITEVKNTKDSQKYETKDKESLKALESEIKIQKRDNAGLNALIQVNADKIDYLRETLRAKNGDIRELEYDYNVVEKESRKLEKQYKKLLNLRICDEEDDPSSSGFSSAVSYDNDSSLDEASETFV